MDNISVTYYLGDVRRCADAMLENSVDFIMSSLPFMQVRAYLPEDHPDKDLEIGMEETPALFLDHILEVTDSLWKPLAEHGSIALELGDAYMLLSDKDGWPRNQSMLATPQLMSASMIYGFNLLNPLHKTYKWILRDDYRWIRTNPPIGNLAKRFRAGATDIYMFAKNQNRYFDSEGVRVIAPQNTSRKYIKRDLWGEIEEQQSVGSGTPALNWICLPSTGVTELPNVVDGIPVEHCATWPSKLCVSPIIAMTPEKVCKICGLPSERMIAPSERYAQYLGQNLFGEQNSPEVHTFKGKHGFDSKVKDRIKASGLTGAEYITLGWSCCGCGDGCEPVEWKSKTSHAEVISTGRCNDDSHWRRGTVLDPFAGTGSTLEAAIGQGRAAVGIDINRRNVRITQARLGDMWPIGIIEIDRGTEHEKITTTSPTVEPAEILDWEDEEAPYPEGHAEADKEAFELPVEPLESPVEAIFSPSPAQNKQEEPKTTVLPVEKDKQLSFIEEKQDKKGNNVSNSIDIDNIIEPFDVEEDNNLSDPAELLLMEDFGATLIENEEDFFEDIPIGDEDILELEEDTDTYVFPPDDYDYELIADNENPF